MDKKKVLAILLFLLMGFFMFTFANPSSNLDNQKTDEKTNEKADEVKEETEEVEEVTVPATRVENKITKKDDTKQLTVEDLGEYAFDDLTVIYDGNEHSITASNLPSWANVTYEGNGKVNVGVYTVIAHITSNDSKYTGSVDLTATLTINKANYNLDDVSFENTNPTYNGENQVIFVSGLDETVIPNIVYTQDGVEVTPKDAGIYRATITYTCSDDNYNCPADVTTVLEISKAKMEITLDDKNSSFGEDIKDLTYTTISGKVYGTDSLGLTMSTTATNASNVGTYDITGSTTNTNYDVTINNGTYTINAKNIGDDNFNSITMPNVAVDYNGEAHSLYVTGTVAGVSVTYDNNSYTNAGEYTVTATLTGTGNYTGTKTLTATLTINKAKIEITLDDQESVYGENIKTLTSSTSGSLYGNDTIEMITKTTATKTSNVGTYPIIGTLTSVNTNYDVAINNGTYTIKAKDISNMNSITMTDSTVPYDGETHSLEVSNMPEGVTATYDNNSYTEVGVYDITATLTGTGNYTGTKTLTAKLTIAKKELSLTWSNDTFDYDGASHKPTAVISDSSITNVNVTVSGEETNAGTYTSEATVDNSNYTISTTTSSHQFTINKIDYEGINDIIFNDMTVNYDGASHSLVATNVPDGVSVGYNNNGQTKSGVYQVTATFLGDSNHRAIPNRTATLTINRVQTGLIVEELPNVQFEFQKGSSVDFTKLIKVYNVYDNDNTTKELTTNYTTNVDTSRVVSGKILTINSNGFINNSLKYNVINEAAYQTKFEVNFNDTNKYRETKKSNCKSNCDSDNKTTNVNVNFNFLEITEHYSEYIDVTEVMVNYTSGSNEELNVSDRIRWSHYDNGYVNPVYLGMTAREKDEQYEEEECFGSFWDRECHNVTKTRKVQGDVMDDSHVINTVSITYKKTKSNGAYIGTYTIVFKYNATTKKFTAIDETKIA